MAATDLTTLDSVREFLRLSDDVQDDMNGLLEAFIAQASRAIHEYTQRELAPASTASQSRIFRYVGGGYLYFHPFDLRAATTVQIDTETDSPTTLVAGSDYHLGSPSRYQQHGCYEYMELRGFGPALRSSAMDYKPWREVTITGTWGFASVPVDVKLAANMLVAWYYRQYSTIPGGDFETMGERYGGPTAWPTAVMQLLSPYRIVAFGAGG